MTDDALLDEPDAAPEPERRFRKRRIVKWILGGIAALLALLAIAVAVLNSPIGQRFIADQIAKVAPASGLRFEVGRIEGDIFGASTLHDVVVSDPRGPFLTIPVVELDWRPLSWLTSGLDIRDLVIRRGTLYRTPELLPGDPDAPTLPNFDIRIDRLQIDDLTVAAGVAGDQAQTVNLLAEADIRDGRVMVRADGRLGERDRLNLLVDAMPDGDRFDIELDYLAPEGGVIAGLVGADAGYRAVISGEGSWSAWLGHVYVARDGERFAAFRLTNRDGLYGIVGQAYPGEVLTGFPADALGDTVSLAAFGTLENSVLDGDVAIRAGGVDADGEGVIDLGNNLLRGFILDARLADPELFGPGLRLEDARIATTLDGEFRDLTIDHRLEVGRLVSGANVVTDLRQSGVATYDGNQWTLPLNTRVARIATGNDLIDPRLVNGTLIGTLNYAGSRLFSEELRIIFPTARANLALRGNTEQGAYRLAGPVSASNLTFENIGTADARADIVFQLRQAGYSLSAQIDGRMRQVTNATLANIAGENIRFAGGVGLGSAAPLTFDDFSLTASKLQLTLDGQVTDGGTTVAGFGTHVDYGDFTVEAALTDAGPEAVLVLANPLPAAGLENVRVVIAPIEGGFRIDTEGGSLLGAFEGQLGLFSPEGGPTRIAIDRLAFGETNITGDLALEDAGARGQLNLAGGGLDGTIGVAPRGGGQGFDVDLIAQDARFGGASPLSIGSARVNLSGLLVDGNSTIQGTATAQGVSYGSIFIGRLAANADLRNGQGTVNAQIAGRRGSRFALNIAANIAPQRIAVAARGTFAGGQIVMPRRAVLLQQGDGGWLLQPTQISYGDGAVIAEGRFGGAGPTNVSLQMADMPLSLIDVAVADMGLGGTISGLVDFTTNGGGVPVGNARVSIENLTRSGLVLTSRPIDLAMVLRLTPTRLETRAVIDEGDAQLGRLQGRILDLPASGALFERLQAGDLFAQLRYSGPAAALWRLAAVDAFDLTGPINLAADVRGTLADPVVSGSIATDNLRVQSALSGTDLVGVSARGNFAGSRLRLTRFAGATPNGGRVTGSGIIDLGNMGAGRGPGLDLRAAASNARLLDNAGLSATVTGPLRIVSDGIGGTIAGRVRIDQASWTLGTAAEDLSLPRIETREINAPYDLAPPAAPSQPWRYLIDAQGSSLIEVDGMGLDSEWGADIILRGTTDDPRIGGEANVVRGAYSFAGTRFELIRGRILFDANTPIDPRLDIVAETDEGGIDVTVNVQGSAQQPEVSFTSIPALPEEEILARLLFGGSITDLSATDALQLGAALASLRGGDGGGLDPINSLRTAIGLDRLRIVSADPALGRETGVALGKNIGRRFYVELVTDGRGYSATELEFQVTSWLSLLASISTIGRESLVAEVSRDY